MNLLFFESSPRLVFRAQKQLTPQDRWYATLDGRHARELVARGEVSVIMVRRCHVRDLAHALGEGWGEGIPGGQQIVVLPRFGSIRFLRSYLRSQQSPVAGLSLL